MREAGEEVSSVVGRAIAGVEFTQARRQTHMKTSSRLQMPSLMARARPSPHSVSLPERGREQASRVSAGDEAHAGTSDVP